MTDAASATTGTRDVSPWRWALVAVAVAATATVAPMFFLGAPSGHDSQFHLASWVEVAGQWRAGIVYPRWAEWANWGYGEPRFIFYPPASWVLGAALGSILPWTAVPVVYIWLTLVAGGMAMWRLAREWLAPTQAAAAGVFFAVNPYNLVVVYYRSDYAELLAGALFPLLILAILRVTRDGWRNAPFLSIVFAGIWLCNAPAAVIATYSSALLLVVAWVLTRSLRPLFASGTAMLGGFGLAAFYILPAGWERKYVQIAQAVTANLRPERNFIFTHAGDPEFILFNWKVSSLALGMVLITGVLGVFVARRQRELCSFWWMLVALGCASAFSMFPISNFAWRALPELRFVQFPWRWLDALAVVFAFFVGAAFDSPQWRPSAKQWTLWLVVLVLLATTAVAMGRDTWWDSDEPSTIADWIQSGKGYEGTDEYAPVGCDRYELPGVNADSEQPPDKPIPEITSFDPASDKVVAGGPAKVQTVEWTPDERILSEQNVTPIVVAVRSVDYASWEAQVDGQPAAIEAAPDTDQILVPVSGGRHRIELRFRRTRDRVAGDVISIASALLLCGLILRERAVRRERSKGAVTTV